jgi:ubiquinone/menaquinone biosynthesis C-methylase UbiE
MSSAQPKGLGLCENTEEEWAKRLGFSEGGYSVKAVDRRLSRPWVTSRTAVLDIGGGTGIDAGPLSKLAKFVVVVDRSKAAVLSGKDVSAQFGFGSCIDYVLGTAEYLPFSDESFGLVVCFSVIDHIRDIRAVKRAILEMARVTLTKGLVSITIPNRLFFPGTMSMIAKRLLERYAGIEERRFSPKELRTLLVEAGLNPVLYDSAAPNSVDEMIRNYILPAIVGRISAHALNRLMRIVLLPFSGKLLGPRFGIAGMKGSTVERENQKGYPGFVR